MIEGEAKTVSIGPGGSSPAPPRNGAEEMPRPPSKKGAKLAGHALIVAGAKQARINWR